MIDYDSLDPGIRRVVRLLNDHGFRTSDSGDGSKAATMECAVDYPMVFVPYMGGHDGGGEELAQGIYDLLRQHSLDTIWEPSMDAPFVQVEYFYHPHSGSGGVTITNFADKDLL